MMERKDDSFLPKQINICQCKNCCKYRVNPSSSEWALLIFDSPDFIQFCLSFIECPENIEITRANILQSNNSSSHSFTLSLDIFNNSKNQKKLAMIHFIVEDVICDFCENLLSSPQVQQWSSTVIISSYLNRSRPLQWLEKEIEKSFQISDSLINMDNANSMSLYKTCSSAENMIKEEGKLTFLFNSKATAFRLVSFIKRAIAVKIEENIEKIPRDPSFISDFTPDYDLNVTYTISLPGIWSDDLVCLPESICQIKGSNCICICTKVSDSIVFVDPETGTSTQISPEIYWDDPFPATLMKSSMVLFDVMSISIYGPKCGRTQMCDMEVVLDSSNLTESSSIIKDQDKDSNNNEDENEIEEQNELNLNFDPILVRSHLGNQLKIGDFCLGYDLRNGIDIPFGSGEQQTIPDAIIVSRAEIKENFNHKFFVNEFIKDGYNIGMIKEHLLVNKVPS